LTAPERAPEKMLLCLVGPRLCGFSIAHVGETMRPLPVEALAGMPAYVSGLALIRGVPMPVIDVGRLLFGSDERPAIARFVTVNAGPRRAALAVGDVIGVRALPAASLGELPALFREVKSEFIESIGNVDGDLFVVLKTAKIVPSSVWSALEAREARP
jgi:purine-binding chemotaxis protein CheW